MMPEWVLRIGLSPPAVSVYTALATYYADRDGFAWPQRKLLAADTGMSLQQVDKATRELVELGCMVKERRGRRGGGVSSCTYELVRERRQNVDRRVLKRLAAEERRGSNLIAGDNSAPENHTNVIADDKINLIAGNKIGGSSLSSEPEPIEPYVQTAAKRAADVAARPSPLAVVEGFGLAWQKRYKQEYRFEQDQRGRISGKVWKMAQRLAATYTAEEFLARVERFLASNERFYVEGAHSFSIFAAVHDRFSRPVETGPYIPTYEEMIERRDRNL